MEWLIEFHTRALADMSSVLSGRRYLGESHQKPLCWASGWAAEPFNLLEPEFYI